MKVKKLLSCFLSIVMIVSTFTALPLTASAETFNDTVVQTVFELKADDIKAGNVPAYVNVNTSILDTTNTSAANGVMSTVVSADTDFIQIDLEAAAKALPGQDTGLYTIEFVTNAVDSDSTTKNGTVLYANGTANKLLLRNREGSDVTTNKNDWSGDQYKAATTITKAHYIIDDLNLSNGTAVSHKATYDTATATGTSLFTGVANGQALTAWSKAPVKGLTIKAANGYRANIASFKITRKATFSSENYIKGEQTVFEMNADTLKAGNVPAGVTLNTTILDSASSVNAGLMSTVVSAETEFLKVDLEKLSKSLPGQDMGLYTIEFVTNAVDSDSTTKNGTILYANGKANKLLLRNREGSDVTANRNDWSGDQYKTATTITKAHYIIDDLNLSNGTAVSHKATYDTATATGTSLFTGVANGQALTAWSNAPVKGFTIKAASGYRANIVSFKITRKAYIENIQYTITAASENDAQGTVAIAGLTDGKVQKGNNVTLTATPASGYVFAGWYKNGGETAVSTDKAYTFMAVEDANYIAKFTSAQEITQTVLEMDIEALKAGTVPAGVTLNSGILNSASSIGAGLMSNVVTAETEFLKLDFAELSKSLPGEDTGIYTIEVVTNAIDSDDATKNGTIMYVNGKTNIMVIRSREAVDYTVLKNDWSGTEYKAVSSVKTSHYTMTDLNLSTGAAASHTAKYNEGSYLLTNIAHDHELSAWSGAPITGITFKAAANYRANIKSLKITRKALVPSVTCVINATTENAERGSVAISGVSQDEATLGQVQSGNEVTLTATRNEGYLFKGWYKEDADTPVSTDSTYTFNVTESANYTARFVESYVANKVVFELNSDDLKAGNVPAGVTLNSNILDENASGNALVSDSVTADTDFLTIDLAKVGINPGDIGGNIYSIELVANLNDADDTTLNGMWLYFNGSKKVLRARESKDFSVMSDAWSTDPTWNAVTGNEAHYSISRLNATTGEADKHLAQRMTDSGIVNQFSSETNASGGKLSAWSGAPVTTLTIKAINGYRANIKSLKITRQVEIPLERVNVEVTTENDSYGIVTDIGDTAVKYSEITLKAEAKEGYIFAGWYDGNVLVSQNETWTFQVLESFSYTAKFRKVVEEWVEVYGMDVEDILAGETVAGVSISNLDRTNSSASKGLLSNASDASTDFMTITFANLPTPETAETDVLTDVYRVDMKLNFVDEDNSTKNGALVYYNEAKSGNMLLRARETRDGTAYNNGSATIYGELGKQKIPVLAYNFKMDTNTGLFNQYVKHGTGDYYLFGNTLTRGDDITLPANPGKIIIRNADYNSGGVNEDYRVNIKSLSVKRLVKVIDTGNAVPVFAKERVTVLAKNGEVWSGYGAFTTDVEKIIIDLGSEVAESEITNDTVFITCNDEKIASNVTATTGVDGVTLATITGMNFESGKTYKIIADGIKNVRGASLQKQNEYVAISAVSTYEGIFVKNTSIDGVGSIAPNTDITVNVQYSNVATEKDVYVIYVAYKGDTTADVKIAKLEKVSGSGNREATITTGDVSDVEKVEFIIWEGWSSMRILDSLGF